MDVRVDLRGDLDMDLPLDLDVDLPSSCFEVRLNSALANEAFPAPAAAVFPAPADALALLPALLPAVAVPPRPTDAAASSCSSRRTSSCHCLSCTLSLKSRSVAARPGWRSLYKTAPSSSNRLCLVSCLDRFQRASMRSTDSVQSVSRSSSSTRHSALQRSYFNIRRWFFNHFFICVILVGHVHLLGPILPNERKAWLMQPKKPKH